MAPKRISSYNFPAPMDNDSLVGHADALNAFMDAWARRDQYPLHPVWILSGARGIGKATLAHKIAKIVYGNVGDFFVINMAHNIDKDGREKTDGKQISVYTIRRVIEQLQLSSMSGGWRVVVIDSMDELNMNAQNALLKVLEEPPAQTIFLAVSHQLSRVLPTICSRSRVEKLHPLTDSQLCELFCKYIPNEDVSKELLHLAAGSFGKIADLKRSGADELYERLQTLKTMNSADMLVLAGQIAKQPETYGILLDAAAAWGLAGLYPEVSRNLSAISAVYLEPETAIFKIMSDMKKLL